MNHLIAELEGYQAGTRTALLVGTGAILAIICGFGVATYSAAKQNLSAEKLQPALMARVEALSPDLQRKAAEAVTLAMPTYQDLAREKVTAISPLLRKSAADEFAQLPEELQRRLTGQMDALQQGVELRLRQEVAARFGDLPQEQVATLIEHFAGEFERVGHEVKSHIEDRYGQQLGQLDKIMQGFDIPDRSAMSDEKLQMKLIEDAALLVVHLARNPEALPDLGGRPIDYPKPEQSLSEAQESQR